MSLILLGQQHLTPGQEIFVFSLCCALGLFMTGAGIYVLRNYDSPGQAVSVIILGAVLALISAIGIGGIVHG